MNAIVAELRATCDLHYNEKKLLDAGRLDDCFSTLLSRRRRFYAFCMCMFYAMLSLLMVVLLAERMSHSGDIPAFSCILLTVQIAMFAALLLGQRHTVTRIETLATLWKVLAPQTAEEPSAASQN